MTPEQVKFQLDYDVAIVGGGIVGATLACALKNSGLKIVLIEAQAKEIAAQRKQAYALTLLSGRIFQGIGVWDKIFPELGKFKNIRLSDADYSKVVLFDTQDLGTDYLGYVAEHRNILPVLQELSDNCSNISWLSPAQVMSVDYQADNVDIDVTVEGNKQKITAKLLVAADGSRSQIRQQAGIKTRGWKYWQSCVAFTVKHEAPPE